MVIFLAEFETSDEIDDGKMDSWLANPLHLWDSFEDTSHISFCIRISIAQLSSSLHECKIFSVFGVAEHLLLDIGAQKSICSSDWLDKVQ